MDRRIAVDVDGVLFPFVQSYLDDVRARTGRIIPFESLTNFEFWPLIGPDRAAVFADVDRFILQPGTQSITPIPGAVETVAALSFTREVVAVTARPPALHGATKSWLAAHFGPTITDCIATNDAALGDGVVRKAAVCVELGVDLFIDDHLDYVVACAARGIRSFLFGRYPWNAAEALPTNVERVADWADISRLL
jgi:deoxypyrimidine-specific 5' nucleotidase type C protein (NT5C)